MENCVYILTLKDAGGGQNDPLVTEKTCMPSIFIKTPQIFFDESCVISAFNKKFFEKLRMTEIGPRGRWKRSSIFQMLHPSKKSMLPKANEQRKKKTICEIFHQKKSESFDENWRNGGHFSKFGHFCITCIFDFSAT